MNCQENCQKIGQSIKSQNIFLNAKLPKNYPTKVHNCSNTKLWIVFTRKYYGKSRKFLYVQYIFTENLVLRYFVSYLETFECCVLLLTFAFVSTHVQMGKCHLEDGVCYPELVVPAREGAFAGADAGAGEGVGEGAGEGEGVYM